MKKKLYRDTSNEVFAGVCAGMAKYFDIDVSIMRLIWVFAGLFLNGGLLIAYIICALVIPEEPNGYTEVNYTDVNGSENHNEYYNSDGQQNQ